MPDDRMAHLRALNDLLRRRHVGGRAFITLGLNAEGRDTVQRILKAVADFTAFDPDNDPYGEHDFGKVVEAGLTVFFVIDYYDLTGTELSPDPADSEQTLRVMTVMLADEY